MLIGPVCVPGFDGIKRLLEYKTLLGWANIPLKFDLYHFCSTINLTGGQIGAMCNLPHDSFDSWQDWSVINVLLKDIYTVMLGWGLHPRYQIHE